MLAMNNPKKKSQENEIYNSVRKNIISRKTFNERGKIYTLNLKNIVARY